MCGLPSRADCTLFCGAKTPNDARWRGGENAIIQYTLEYYQFVSDADVVKYGVKLPSSAVVMESMSSSRHQPWQPTRPVSTLLNSLGTSSDLPLALCR